MRSSTVRSSRQGASGSWPWAESRGRSRPRGLHPASAAVGWPAGGLPGAGGVHHADRDDRVRTAVGRLSDSCQTGSVHCTYRSGHIFAECWNSPRYMPVGDSVVGIRPLSRFAMQIARSASPGTGPKRSTAQRILRFMKCWIVSSAARSALHGPTPWFAETGGATKIAVASASTKAALRMRVRTGFDASRRAHPSSTLPPERQYTP